MTKSERWILSEWWVAKDRASRFGERLLAHRERTPFAEADLIFEVSASSLTFQRLPKFERESLSSLIVLVEVKTISGELGWREALPMRQRVRLQRARLYLEDRYRVPVRLELAVVNLAAVLSPRETLIRYFEISTAY